MIQITPTIRIRKATTKNAMIQIVRTSLTPTPTRILTHIPIRILTLTTMTTTACQHTLGSVHLFTKPGDLSTPAAC